MENEVKAKVRQQFGASAEGYVVSDVHAKGESLAALVELIEPQANWFALDVATGAGHTALTFAPHVDRVVALDLTEPMLAATRAQAAARGITNLSTVLGDAERIPFADGSFELVTCRLAFHHFPNPHTALREFVRVLRPGGLVGFTDNFTVDHPAAAAYYNAFEKLRDPSHQAVLGLDELCKLFEDNGLAVSAVRRFTKEFEFQDWADRQHVEPSDKLRLLQMMRTLPGELEPLFQPRWADGTLYFQLWEAVLRATRKG